MLCLWFFLQVIDSTVQIQKSPNIKSRGAYYTDFHWANWLSEWAIRSASDLVLDPSYGGGIFLESSLQVLQNFGTFFAHEQIFGVEIDAATHASTKAYLSAKQKYSPRLFCADFFSLEPGHLPKMNVIIGNPPFVRSQSQSSKQKQQMLQRALAQGLKISRQSNIWLPFILHSCSFLKPGGRLAFVVPFEIGQAKYAKPLLHFLGKHFKKTHFITFTKPLFTSIHQDVVLLLAEGYGTAGTFFLTDLQSETMQDLKVQNITQNINGGHAQSFSPEVFEKRGFSYFWLNPELRSAYDALLLGQGIHRLGDLAQIKNGYVTGANHFFHLSQDELKAWNLNAKHVKKTVYRSGSFLGISFTKADWKKAESRGKAGYVLRLSKPNTRSQALKDYLSYGEKLKLHLNYKCRTRNPWYRLYNLSEADAYLSYMSGDRVKLVHNAATVTAPNSLHHISLKEKLNSQTLCILWQSSLTQLSTELEGHMLGGGMLKLEPFEAAKILVAYKPIEASKHFSSIDRLIRRGKLSDAEGLANTLITDLIPKALLDDFQTAAHYLKMRRRKLKNPTSSWSDD